MNRNVFPEGGWRFLRSAALVLMICPAPAAALDIFTLWRQPMIPLEVVEGGWVDYKSVTQAGGRRSEELVRIQCVGRYGSQDAGGWVVEILPLDIVDGKLGPLPGEGLLLHLSQRLLRRDAPLAEIIERVERWRDGRATVLAPEQWREDPFVSSSLRTEFVPYATELLGNSVRVVSGKEINCDQFQMTAVDSQRVALPYGQLEQVSRWEITAAVNADIPFLGLVFAAERNRSESRLDPPSDRFAPPPPVTRVKTMELIAYGDEASPELTRATPERP